MTVGSSSPFANAGVYQNQFEAGSNLNWVHGKHTFSFGADYSRTQLNVLNENNEVATIRTNDFASFLEGQLHNNGTRLFVGQSNRYYRANQLGLYAQDKWKATPNLTVDVGLRFDYNGPLSEKYGRLTNFNPSAYQYDLATDTVVNDGLVIAENYPQHGTKGAGASTLLANQFGFAPRVGIAWSPSFVKSVVVRAGFGLYYDRGEYFTEFSPSAGSGFNGPFGVTLERPSSCRWGRPRAPHSRHLSVPLLRTSPLAIRRTLHNSCRTNRT
jgi:outer membrane receptor protein involved in Fe transport